jgi:hypothetical protein
MSRLWPDSGTKFRYVAGNIGKYEITEADSVIISGLGSIPTMKPPLTESRQNRLVRHSHVFIAHAAPGVWRIFGRKARPQGPIVGRLPNAEHHAACINVRVIE